MKGYFHNVLRSDALTFSLSGLVRRKLPFHSFVINDHLDLDKGKEKMCSAVQLRFSVVFEPILAEL